MSRLEEFGSRWGLIIATLGMAVGTGNIWRFPRIAASNGGGSFLVAWVIFLFLWSVPLMIVEFSFGKRARRGAIGAFVEMGGRGYAWMGGFVAICASAIMFYYSVVTGWCFRFLAAALAGGLSGQGEAEALWTSFAGTPRSNVCRWTTPAWYTSTVSCSESALTHETPTPCRPPETL